ncbi:PEP-CTERM sorting domain-containing protein [Anabaena cylindrica]|uniref:PEP-CTERM sorting domain-containing protein n=1 Tax=Anabaena cylindrica TaxID=1165 RepID=UPI003A4E3483
MTGTSGQIFGSASLPSTGPQTSVPEPTSVLGLFALATIGVGSMIKKNNKTKLF